MGEFPFEGLGDPFIVILKAENPFCQIGKGKEVIGREQFSLDDGEVDFDLVQPAGMDGEMDDNDLWPFALKSVNGGQSPVRRPIVENPKNPFGRRVWLAGHHVFDQTVEGYDPGLGLAPAKQLCPSHIPSGKVAQRPSSRVFKFYLLSLACPCTKTSMTSMSCLNARLFIGGDHKIVRPERKSIPYPLIEIEDPARFLLKVRLSLIHI